MTSAYYPACYHLGYSRKEGGVMREGRGRRERERREEEGGEGEEGEENVMVVKT